LVSAPRTGWCDVPTTLNIQAKISNNGAAITNSAVAVVKFYDSFTGTTPVATANGGKENDYV
jgi:hypothetical protein